MLSAGNVSYSTTHYMTICKYCKTLKQRALMLGYVKNTQIIPNSLYSTTQQLDARHKLPEIDPKVEALRSKLLYSDYFEKRKLKFGYANNKRIENMRMMRKKMRTWHELINTPAYSIALKYLTNEEKNHEDKNHEHLTEEEHLEENKGTAPIQMPYSNVAKSQIISDQDEFENPLPLNERYRILYEKYLQAKNTESLGQMELNFDDYLVQSSEENDTTALSTDDVSQIPANWMVDYEFYNDENENNSYSSYYGTPKPDVGTSSIPCGGCGALLHCRDIAIPGYLPSELFVGRTNNELKTMICQRCHFMKNYNTALKVNVSPDQYPELLKKLKGKKMAVILMVDLMDFPCSVWPDIMSIVGKHVPVFIVGNKVDLLPQDSSDFFVHVKKCLSKSLEESGIGKANIKDILLVSAKTGYGIEELINKLHNKWEYRGDVYLIGCTNVGKSSLFNALIQSDYCKVQAVDLVQRATTAPWPGTTLNLLKFPILNPQNWRLLLRTRRLISETSQKNDEAVLRKDKFLQTGKIRYATLEGKVGQTFSKKPRITNYTGRYIANVDTQSTHKFGLDEKHPEFKSGHWCFDTPGVIQHDQFLHLLSTDELMLTLPKEIISPRSFVLHLGDTLFLAGLGRLDLIETSGDFIRICK
ncbi:nitric oxide-associated protein 1 isoform X2 [Cephus cinctus]|uniref:Nitric oxide-associated protein 1 isoform X2 n=1 Tax=Cephus cinctus TaxID=211228 RepID=A0AAJ7R9L7_CEPCN|nr:nitric oxide-associated protein 1 isoform X2 [Cephus cinctus]